MSTTAPNPEPRRKPAADRVFERRIWTNPEICNECFQRLFDVREIETPDREGSWGRTIEERYPTDDAVHGHDEVKEGVFRSRPFCETCGGRGHCLDRDHSLEELVDRVPALTSRVAEEGVAVDVDSVYTFVRRFGSVPELQGEDRELLEAAIWFGVERSRGRLRNKMAFRRRLRSGQSLPDFFDSD